MAEWGRTNFEKKNVWGAGVLDAKNWGGFLENNFMGEFFPGSSLILVHVFMLETDFVLSIN